MPRDRAEPDCYRLLGVSRDCTAAEVREAYLRCAERLHPDRGGNVPDDFKALRWAYEILSDAECRAHYDLHPDHFAGLRTVPWVPHVVEAAAPRASTRPAGPSRRGPHRFGSPVQQTTFLRSTHQQKRFPTHLICGSIGVVLTVVVALQATSAVATHLAKRDGLKSVPGIIRRFVSSSIVIDEARRERAAEDRWRREVERDFQVDEQHVSQHRQQEIDISARSERKERANGMASRSGGTVYTVQPSNAAELGDVAPWDNRSTPWLGVPNRSLLGRGVTRIARDDMARYAHIRGCHPTCHAPIGGTSRLKRHFVPNSTTRRLVASSLAVTAIGHGMSRPGSQRARRHRPRRSIGMSGATQFGMARGKIDYVREKKSGQTIDRRMISTSHSTSNHTRILRNSVRVTSSCRGAARLNRRLLRPVGGKGARPALLRHWRARSIGG